MAHKTVRVVYGSLELKGIKIIFGKAVGCHSSPAPRKA